MFGPIYKPHLLMRISKKSSLVGCHNISLYKALTSITKPALPFSLSFFYWALGTTESQSVAICHCSCSNSHPSVFVCNGFGRSRRI